MKKIPDELKDELQLAKDSYKEVLDATKHQDERIGRFLTAIAFLVSAGIALSTSKRIIGADFLMNEGSHTTKRPVLAYGFGAFLVLSLLSVGWFILSLATQLTLPEGSAKPGGKHMSFLYFRSISRYSQDDWKTCWTTESNNGTLAQHTLDLYLGEIHNLALRANVKYERFREGTALFIMAVAALVSSAPLLVDTLVDGVGDKDALRNLQWNAGRALGVATALALFASAISYHSWQQARAMSRVDGARDRDLLLQVAIQPLLVVFVASEVATASGFRRVVVTMLALLSPLPALRLRKWKPNPAKSSANLVFIAMQTCVALLAVWSTFAGHDFWRLVAAASAVFVLEVPTLLDAIPARGVNTGT